MIKHLLVIYIHASYWNVFNSKNDFRGWKEFANPDQLVAFLDAEKWIPEVSSCISKRDYNIYYILTNGVKSLWKGNHIEEARKLFVKGFHSIELENK